MIIMAMQDVIEKIEAMKIKMELSEPRLEQMYPAPSEPFWCRLCGMSEVDIMDNKLENDNCHCNCSIWNNPVGGDWVGWYDEKKALEYLLNYPSEENAHNNALDAVIDMLKNGEK